MSQTFVLNNDGITTDSPSRYISKFVDAPFSLQKHTEYLKALKIIKDKRIVFAGCARDIIPTTMSSNIGQIRSISHLFKDLSIMVIENDSSVSFKEYLYGIKGIDAICVDLNIGKLGGGRDKSRVSWMKTLRNCYHKRIAANYSHYDYVAVFDYDLYFWRPDGFISSFSLLNKYSVVGANGIQSIPKDGGYKDIYYDSFAFIDITGKGRKWNEEIPPFAFNQKEAPVIACGGGIILYKMSDFLARPYGNILIDDETVAEHAYQQIHLKCCVNPNMIVIR